MKATAFFTPLFCFILLSIAASSTLAEEYSLTGENGNSAICNRTPVNDTALIENCELLDSSGTLKYRASRVNIITDDQEIAGSWNFFTPIGEPIKNKINFEGYSAQRAVIKYSKKACDSDEDGLVSSEEQLGAFGGELLHTGIVNGKSWKNVKFLPNKKLKILARQTGYLSNGFTKCNGFTSGPNCNLVRTAMHCVANPKNGDRISTSLNLIPQTKRSEQKAGARLVDYDRDNYTKYEEYDWAHLELDRSFSGCIDVKINTTGYCDGDLYLIGYHGDNIYEKVFDKCEQLNTASEAKRLGLMKYSCDTVGGVSGSPVFCLHKSGDITLAATHINSGNDTRESGDGVRTSSHNWGVIPKK